MSSSVCTILLQMLALLSPSLHQPFTQEELKVVQSLGTSLGVKSFVFVRDHDPLDVLEELRDFCESDIFCTVMNSYRLDKVLKNAVRKEVFFGVRSVFVTREHLNFTHVMAKLSGLYSITWVVFTDSLTALKNYYIPMNTNFFIVQIGTNRITINRGYNIKPGFKLSLESIGILSKTNIPKSIIGVGRREINFEKAILNMLYYSSKEACRNASVHYVLFKMECFHQEIVRIASVRLNFRINGVPCRERHYPYNYPNGSLSELFLVLDRGEAEISSGSYIVNYKRLGSYDFVWPIFTTSSMMYIKFIGTEIDWRAYVRPVSNQVWAAIGSWIVITGILIHYFDKFRSGNFSFKFRPLLISKLVKSVFVTLQVFCNQGVENISQWYSDRTIFMVTYLLFVSMYQAYAGCLISSLTVSLPDIPFRDINEFFQDGTYRLMTVQRGFHNYFVKQVIREMKMENKNIMLEDNYLPVDPQNGIAILCANKKLVYVEFRENIVQYPIPCKITELPKSMLYRNIGIGLPKHSPYRQILNRELTLIRSTGILHRMKINLLSYKGLEEKEIVKEEYIKVSIENVFSIFFILGSGLAIAIILFFVEFVSFHGVNNDRWRKRYKRKSLHLMLMHRNQRKDFSNFPYGPKGYAEVKNNYFYVN